MHLRPCFFFFHWAALLGSHFTDPRALRPVGNVYRPGGLSPAASGIKNLHADHRHWRQLLLENLFNVLFGGSSRFFSAPDWFNNTLTFGHIIITNVAWVVPLITVLLLLAILWLLYRTRYGMAIRAVAFDVNTVRLMGIDANRIISLVFATGSSLAALGGVFYSISYPTIDPLMGVLIGLKAFAAAVLGGIGSVTGAVLGGFILGFTEVVAVALYPELGVTKTPSPLCF